MGNAGHSAQSLPSSQSEFSATAQVPRPAVPKAFAPEQKAVDMAPSEQMPSYELGHVFEHIIIACIALARSPDNRGMLSITPRSVRTSSSGDCGCGLGESSAIGDPLSENSRSSGSTMNLEPLAVERMARWTSTRPIVVGEEAVPWSIRTAGAMWGTRQVSRLEC